MAVHMYEGKLFEEIIRELDARIEVLEEKVGIGVEEEPKPTVTDTPKSEPEPRLELVHVEGDGFQPAEPVDGEVPTPAKE